MAEWFRRQSAKIKTTDKLEIVEGTWLKCPQCQEVLYRKMLKEMLLKIHYIYLIR